MWQGFDFLFAALCAVISVFFAILAFVARKSSRKRRRKDLENIDTFVLEHHALLKLTSRRKFMQGKCEKMKSSHPRYSEVRTKVNKYLSENKTFKHMSEHIFNSLKSSLTNRLSFCPNANKSREDLMLEMRKMKMHFSECSEEALLNQAVMLEFRERTMMNAFSLIGSRVYYILVKTWQETKINEDKTSVTSRWKTWARKYLEKIHPLTGLCLACNKSYLKSNFFIFTSGVVLVFRTILRPVGIWIWDNVSDVQVFIYFMSMISDQPLLSSINPSSQNMLHEVIFFLVILGAVMVFSLVTFLFSMVSCTSWIPRMILRPFAVQHMMEDPYKVDMVDTMIYSDSLGRSWLWWPGDIATRYQLSLSEAGAESIGQFVGQWSMYLCIDYLVSMWGHVEDNASLTKVALALCMQSLKMSTIASIVSLTYTQMRNNSIAHEFSIGLKQQVLYLCASLLNTLSSCTVLIAYSTYCFDLTVLLNYKCGYLYAFLLLAIILSSYVLVSFAANFWTRKDDKDLCNMNGMPSGWGDSDTSATYTGPVIRFLDFSDNIFSPMRLPTSTYCSKTQYITNHNQVNAKIVLMTSRHYLVTSIYFLLTAIVCGAHIAFVKLDPTFKFLPGLPGEESQARWTLMICTLATPILGFLALLVTWCYLSGCQFSANCHFRWLQHNYYNLGIWEDLGPAQFTLANFLGLTV